MGWWFWEGVERKSWWQWWTSSLLLSWSPPSSWLWLTWSSPPLWSSSCSHHNPHHDHPNIISTIHAHPHPHGRSRGGSVAWGEPQPRCKVTCFVAYSSKDPQILIIFSSPDYHHILIILIHIFSSYSSTDPYILQIHACFNTPPGAENATTKPTEQEQYDGIYQRRLRHTCSLGPNCCHNQLQGWQDGALFNYACKSSVCTFTASDLTNPEALTPPSCIADPPFVTSDHLFSHLSPVKRWPTKQHCTPPTNCASCFWTSLALSSPTIPSSGLPSCPKNTFRATSPISDRDRVCVWFSSVTGSCCCCDRTTCAISWISALGKTRVINGTRT